MATEENFWIVSPSRDAGPRTSMGAFQAAFSGGLIPGKECPWEMRRAGHHPRDCFPIVFVARTPFLEEAVELCNAFRPCYSLQPERDAVIRERELSVR